MLTLGSFKSLAKSYGGSVERWPADVQQEARATLAASEVARNLLREEHTLDGMLMRATEATAGLHAAATRHEAPDAALTRLRSGVAARIGAASPPPRRLAPDWLAARSGGWLATLGNGTMTARWFGLATSSGVLLAGGFWIGWIQTNGGPVDLLGALQQAPIGGLPW